MFLEEAIAIKEILKRLNVHAGQIVLDLGSQTEEYRCLSQPYIDYYIFRPLREVGAKTIHIDRFQNVGVDIVLDLASPEDNILLNEIPPADILLCTSLLEHVVDRKMVLERVKKLTKPGGVIILTVPYIFRYHADPIDTMYRPSNSELEKFFPSDTYSIITSNMIETETNPIITWPKRSLFFRILRRIIRIFHLEVKDGKPTVTKNKCSILAVKKL